MCVVDINAVADMMLQSCLPGWPHTPRIVDCGLTLSVHIMQSCSNLLHPRHWAAGSHTHRPELSEPGAGDDEEVRHGVDLRVGHHAEDIMD
jgi:hypothetical protein